MNENDFLALQTVWRRLVREGKTTLSFREFIKTNEAINNRFKEPKVADILYARHAKEFQGFDKAKQVACVVVSGAPKRAAA